MTDVVEPGKEPLGFASVFQNAVSYLNAKFHMLQTVIYHGSTGGNVHIVIGTKYETGGGTDRRLFRYRSYPAACYNKIRPFSSGSEQFLRSGVDGSIYTRTEDLAVDLNLQISCIHVPDGDFTVPAYQQSFSVVERRMNHVSVLHT